MEPSLQRKNRVFTLILVTFSLVWLLCGAVNFLTESEYDYISGLGAMGISAIGGVIGLRGFQALQSMQSSSVLIYAAAITVYAVCFLGAIVVFSLFEYQKYLLHHSWELKTTISLLSLCLFLVISGLICAFGSYIAIRLSKTIQTYKSNSQELMLFTEKQETEGSSSRNPMTELPE